MTSARLSHTMDFINVDDKKYAKYKKTKFRCIKRIKLLMCCQNIAEQHLEKNSHK